MADNNILQNSCYYIYYNENVPFFPFLLMGYLCENELLNIANYPVVDYLNFVFTDAK